MAVTTTISSKTINGDATLTSWSLGMPVVAEEDITAVRTTASGVETTLTRGIDFSVTELGTEKIAQFSYPLTGAPLPTGDSIFVVRNGALLQNFFNVSRASSFSSKGLEEGFDRFALLLQDQRGTLQQIVDEGFDASGITAETLGLVIGQDVQGFSNLLASLAAGDNTTLSGKLSVPSLAIDGATFSDFMVGLSAAANAATARTTLDVYSKAQANALVERFTSTAQTITSGGLLTLAHGMAVAPRLVSFRLVCTAAAGAAGYAENDVVLYPSNVSTTENTNRFNSVWVDATNVYVRLTSATNCFVLGNKATGNLELLDNADWALYVEARL